MSLSLSPNPWFTGFDDDGIIIPGGKLFTYAAGTTTKLNTYTDVAGLVANTNPIILDAAGRVPSGLFLLPASYKFVLAPANDTDPPTNALRSQDNIIATAPYSVAIAIEGVAGETIGPNQAVYESQGDGGRTAGRWYKMDADFPYASNTAVQTGWVAGQILSGVTGQIQTSGVVTTAGLVVPGTIYYASATAGDITSTAPINRRIIGTAITASSLLLGIAQPWTATAVPLSTANTPVVGAGGALVRRTDGPRGLFIDTGAQWISVNGGMANVRDFGATGDGTTNDAAAIQAAIDTGVARVYIPEGDYNLGTTSLTCGLYQTLMGAGIGSSLTFRSRLLFSGNGSAIVDTHAVNSSGYAQITIQDLYIVGSGSSSTGAAIELNAGGFAYYTIRRCRIGGTFKYGIIGDGIELAYIYENVIENSTGPANSCGIWIVNGDSRRSTQALGFSNVISITDNQINGQVWGIIDDGGNSHRVIGNNLNGNAVPMAFAGLTDSEIMQNNCENAGVVTGNANILFNDRSAVGGGSLNVDKTPCRGILVAANGLRADMAATNSMIKFTATTAAAYHLAITVTNNCFGNQLGRGSAIDVTRLGRSFCGYNNDEATTAHYTGVHNEANVAGYDNANTLLKPGGTSDSLTNAFAILQPCLSGTKAWTPTAALADNAVSSTAQTIVGAAVGDVAIASFTPIGAGVNVLVTANVEAADTVRVFLLNKTGGALTLGAGTSRFTVFKPTV